MRLALIDLLVLTRPRNSISVIIAVAAGYFWVGGSNLQVLSIAMFIMFVVNSAATLINDIYDKGIDTAGKRKSPLIDGKVSTVQVWAFSAILVFTAICLTVIMSPNSTPEVILGVSLLLAWSYNCPPIYSSRKPILSIVVLACCVGLTTVLFGAAMAPALDISSVVIFAIGWTLLRASLVPFKDFKDFEADQKANKNTMLVRYGQKSVKLTSVVLGVLGGGALILASVVTSSWGVLVIFILYTSTNLYIKLSTYSTQSYGENSKLFSDLLLVANIFELAIVLWLFIF